MATPTPWYEIPSAAAGGGVASVRAGPLGRLERLLDLAGHDLHDVNGVRASVSRPPLDLGPYGMGVPSVFSALLFLLGGGRPSSRLISRRSDIHSDSVQRRLYLRDGALPCCAWRLPAEVRFLGACSPRCIPRSEPAAGEPNPPFEDGSGSTYLRCSYGAEIAGGPVRPTP